VRDEAVARARIATTVPPLPATGDPVGGINLYSVTADLQVHSRVFVPDLAVPEDPATGSAAAGLGMALRARGLASDGAAYRIRQGVEMGRPSLLLGRVGAGISVAGQVHPIARGEIRVP
jgi:trans-2,3-dihydro-3-hydroxyanthranilate isomerase